MQRRLTIVLMCLLAAPLLMASNCARDAINAEREGPTAPPMPTPTARSTAAFNFVAAGLAVQFFNESTGATDYLWDFADASGQATEPEPLHIYEKPGSYRVRLRACPRAGSPNSLCDTADAVVTVTEDGDSIGVSLAGILGIPIIGNRTLIAVVLRVVWSAGEKMGLWPEGLSKGQVGEWIELVLNFAILIFAVLKGKDIQGRLGKFSDSKLFR